METKIRVYAKKVKDQKFYSYSYYSEKTAKFYEVKFTQDADNAPNPKNDGYYLLTFDKKESSLEKNRKTYYTDDKGVQQTRVLNDAIWIKALVDWKEDKEYLAQKQAEMEAELEEIF